MARATNDLNAVRDVMGPGIMYGMNTVTIVVASIVLMVRIDPILTVAALLPLPLLAFLVRNFAGEMHRRSARRSGSLRRSLLGPAGEHRGHSGRPGLRPGDARGGALRRARAAPTCASASA